MVRVSAIETLTPLLSYDRSLAISLFVEACDHPREEMLGADSVSEMIFYTWQDGDQVEPVIRRMAASTKEDVAKQGCYWSVVSWIGEGRCKDVALGSLQGNVPKRVGAAEAVVSLAREPSWRLRAAEEIEKLFEDPEGEVIAAVLELFRQDWIFESQEGISLTEAFVASSGFAHDPSDLLMVWSVREGTLAPLARAILAASHRLSGDLAGMVDHPSGHGSATPYYLAPILVRLFQEIQGKGDKVLEEQCLDALDAWLRAHPGKSFRLLDQLDK